MSGRGFNPIEIAVYFGAVSIWIIISCFVLSIVWFIIMWGCVSAIVAWEVRSDHKEPVHQGIS